MRSAVVVLLFLAGCAGNPAQPPGAPQMPGEEYAQPIVNEAKNKSENKTWSVNETPGSLAENQTLEDLIGMALREALEKEKGGE